MITGDSRAVAHSVPRRLGIDDVVAQVLPAEKVSAVKRFQEGGKTVAMVGDGVNDAPALATADVGFAIGAGTDVAVESAGIVLVRSDPRDVVRAIELSRAAYRKMIQNLLWATLYNLIAIPAAAGLFIRWRLDPPMSVGALAMNLSTVICGSQCTAPSTPEALILILPGQDTGEQAERALVEPMTSCSPALDGVLSPVAEPMTFSSATVGLVSFPSNLAGIKPQFSGAIRASSSLDNRFLSKKKHLGCQNEKL